MKSTKKELVEMMRKLQEEQDNIYAQIQDLNKEKEEKEIIKFKKRFKIEKLEDYLKKANIKVTDKEAFYSSAYNFLMCNMMIAKMFDSPCEKHISECKSVYCIDLNNGRIYTEYSNYINFKTTPAYRHKIAAVVAKSILKDFNVLWK